MSDVTTISELNPVQNAKLPKSNFSTDLTGIVASLISESGAEEFPQDGHGGKLFLALFIIPNREPQLLQNIGRTPRKRGDTPSDDGSDFLSERLVFRHADGKEKLVESYLEGRNRVDTIHIKSDDEGE